MRPFAPLLVCSCVACNVVTGIDAYRTGAVERPDVRDTHTDEGADTAIDAAIDDTADTAIEDSEPADTSPADTLPACTLQKCDGLDAGCCAQTTCQYVSCADGGYLPRCKPIEGPTPKC